MPVERKFKVNKDEAIKLASAKIEHEHSRWNTWVLFFFGSIVSTFTLWGQFKDSLPSYSPFIVCAFLSLLWVFVALGIRRVTASWVKVIAEIEGSSSNDFKVNESYKKHEAGHKIYDDLREFSLFRVTKVLTYLGIILFILFIAIAIFFFNKPLKQSSQTIEIKNITEITRNLQSHDKQLDDIQQKIILIEKQLSHNQKISDLNKK
jgi:amino acid transporter